MRKRDFYEILGVSRQSPAEEIRRAYRRLARRYSPDVNLWDARAEGLFEEIREAYRVVGDPAARALYDRLGHQAFEPARDGDAAPVGRGDDIHYAIELELGEALRGGRAEIDLTRLEPCEVCGGGGGVGGQAGRTVPDVPGTAPSHRRGSGSPGRGPVRDLPRPRLAPAAALRGVRRPRDPRPVAPGRGDDSPRCRHGSPGARPAARATPRPRPVVGAI